jgi:hypothetical protein
MAIVFVLIFATALATSQEPRTSPGIDLINFDNLSLMEYDEPIVYDIGNGSHCNISPGFESSCSGKIMSSLKGVEGKDGKALQLLYALDNCSNSYAEINLSFDPPQDLSAYDHLVIDWKGNQRANSLNVGIADAEGTQQIAPLYRNVTKKSWWGPLVVPFRYIGRDLDFSEVKKIFISVKNDSDTEDYKNEGGIGSIAIDNLRAINISARKVPLDFENVKPDLNASKAAAKWLLSQQQPTGLLKSWEDEDNRLAHLYDQALALIVFSQEENMSDNATQLVNVLVEMQKQNKDGSWNQTYDFSTCNSTTTDKWIGDVAWVVYALNRYIELVGEHPGAKKAIDNGTIWLQDQIKSSPAEGAIDTWWALQASGMEKESNNLRDFIIASYWDESAGRFKAGKDDWKPVSDVQTWGAAMLKATGEKEKALRALSYAREALSVSSQDQKVTALGDQAGPWSVSNECTGQYIVAGGEGSNEFLQELVSQQRDDGAMPGSPDNFKGAGAWNTQWHGVAPTAWLYFASNKGPFDDGIAE